MNISSFVKFLLEKNEYEEAGLLETLIGNVEEVTLDMIDELKPILSQEDSMWGNLKDALYAKADTEVRYKMWELGYVDSCPVNSLLKKLEIEDDDTLVHIKNDLDVDLPMTKAYFSDIENEIVLRLKSARKSIKVAMAWFTNPVIFETLLRQCKKGVSVTLLINNDRINNRIDGLPFDKLIQNGAELHVVNAPSLIHHKFCIIDDQIVIDGSYNWTILAERNNDENIVVMEHGNVIETFIDAFKKLISQYSLVLRMPDEIPDKPEYDVCSYHNFNSQEYLILAKTARSKNKEKRYYKNAYRAMPCEITEDEIPSEVASMIKDELKKEQSHDQNLVSSAIESHSKKLNKDILLLNKRTEKLDEDIAKKETKIAAIQTKFDSKIKAVDSKKLSDAQKRQLVKELRLQRNREANKVRRELAKNRKVKKQFSVERSTLVSRVEMVKSLSQQELKGGEGLCRINLAWQTIDDLDLHLKMPDSKEVYYSEKKQKYKNTECELDYDVNAGAPYVTDAQVYF